MSTANGRVDRLPLLDGMRTLAALGVVLYHAAASFGGVILFDRMYLFVDLFFMLSGFVLTLAAEPKMALGLNAWDFLKGRIRRLWPMVALGAFLGALAILIDKPPLLELLGVLLLALLMVPVTSSPVAIFPLNGPQWSIMWELIANFVHAAWLQPLSERSILLIASITGVMFVCATYYVGWAGFGATSDDWWMAAPRVAWAYVLGIWFARVWQRTKPARTVHWFVPLVAPALILAGLPYLPVDQAAGDSVFLILVLPLLFWLALNAELPEAVKAPLTTIGALSFPLYSVHIPIMHAFRLGSDGSDYDLLAGIISIAAATFIAAFAPKVRSVWAARSGRRIAYA